MDVFTATVQQILEDITCSSALGVNSDKPYDENTRDNALLPKVLDVRKYSSTRNKKGKPKRKVSVQRRNLTPTL